MAEYYYSKRIASFLTIKNIKENKNHYLAVDIDELRTNFENFTNLFETYIIELNSNCRCVDKYSAMVSRLKLYLSHNRLDKKVLEYNDFFKCFIDGNFKANNDYAYSIKMVDVEKIYNWLSSVNNDQTQQNIIRGINKKLRHLSVKTTFSF
ncbi:MAG: hypothetical protein PHN72_02195 [Bacilli bacterium]|nr:hypothetical protein [Bacilli bacterium]